MRIEPLSTCERNFIRECILINKRVDGRSSDDFRKFDISISESDGIIIAMLGKTKVSAQINSHTFQPRPHHPQNGSLHIDVDMSPMASPNHDNRLLGRRGLELTSFLEALYRDSECIDFESLCIKEGELAVELKIMVRILDDEGSLFDCASIAITTALSLYRRPFVEIRDGLAITYSASEKALVPIDLYHKPFSITFGFMKDISFPILDPTDRETLCLEGSLVIGCNKRGEVCNLFQSGRLLINHEMVLKCIARALSRCEHVTDLIVAVVERQKRSEMGVTSVPMEITNPNVPGHVQKRRRRNVNWLIFFVIITNIIFMLDG